MRLNDLRMPGKDPIRLNDLRMPGQEGMIDLVIADGKIVAVLARGEDASGMEDASRPEDASGTVAGQTEGISFDGALVFPGLINSHDHLDFNLFPLLGNRVYTNYRQWGPDIQSNQSSVIRDVLKVPRNLRIAWGIYKNLLNGFTTVINHGDELPVDDPLIDVFQQCHCLHSVGFDKYWKWKLNRPLAGRRPFVLHVGEGTDALAWQEIDQLIRWNLFKRPLIGVHGVAMNEEQANAFRALVWCPTSNYFLLNRTAPVARLKERVPILFGTDSTLTGGWNGWQQIRQAREEEAMTDPELLATLTKAPAAAWGLTDRGEIAVGKVADLVIARPKAGHRGMDAFFGLDPEDLLLVIHHGRIRVFDQTLLGPLTAMGLPATDFCATGQGGKYVEGDLPGLMEEIRGYYPEMAFPAMP
jgi:cytosine/adenosine deaminase-related metal-dependent hydrolase